MQFIKFGLIGVLNTIIHYAVFILLDAVGVPYIIAYAVGFILSTLHAFLWGNFCLFKQDNTKEKRVWWKALLKVYAAYLTGFILSSTLMWLWVDIIHLGNYFMFLSGLVQLIPFLDIQDIPMFLSKTIGFCIDICITLPINYTMNKRWAYKQKG